MSNSASIKIVSQTLRLEYEGVAKSSGTAAASRMAQLFAQEANGSSGEAKANQKSSISHLLYSNTAANMTDGDTKPMAFVFKDGLTRFSQFDDPKARSARRDFFDSVEAGKKGLVEKYGDHIPAEAVAALAASLKGKSVTIMKHQIVTTRTSDTFFEGSRRNRDGVYTSTVKSKTIYTYGPLSEAQIEEIKGIILGEKHIAENDKSRTIIAQRSSVAGIYKPWTTANGNIMLKEVKTTHLTPSCESG